MPDVAMRSTDNVAFCSAPPLLSPTPSKRKGGVIPKCCSAPDNNNNNNPHQHATPSPSRRRFLIQLLSLPLLSPVFAADENVLSSKDAPPSIATEVPLPPPPPPSSAAKAQKWSYTAPTGPANWADLSPDYAAAANGTQQSPIPLSYRSAVTSTNLEDRPTLSSNNETFLFKLRESSGALDPSFHLEQYIPPHPPLVGDAPPIDVPGLPPPPAVITYDSVTYAFRDMHLHAPRSEHVIENVAGVAEFHLIFDKRSIRPPTKQPTPPPAPAQEDSSSVSTSSSTLNSSSDIPSSSTTVSMSSNSEPLVPSNQLLSSKPLLTPPAANAADSTSDSPKPQSIVVAVLAKKSTKSAPWLDTLLSSYREKAGPDSRSPGILLDLDIGSTVLSEFCSTDLYVYSGSMTTPPCTEGVLWVVLRAKCPMSMDDVNMIKSYQRGDNVRPLQRVNGRKVVRFVPEALPTKSEDGTTNK